jgi:hypothetical protein
MKQDWEVVKKNIQRTTITKGGSSKHSEKEEHIQK